MVRALTLLLVCLGCAPALAQQPQLPPADTAIVELRLVDGTTLAGRVVARTDTSCTVVTAAGLTVVVPRRSLTSWSGPEIPGPSRFGRADPGRTRLFLAPTGRTLARGEGYVGDYYVLFPVVGYGITDRFTLAGGMSAIPGLTIGQQLFYLAPKVSLVRSPTFNLGVGALYMRLLWSSVVNAWGGVGYGVATLGGEDAALTLGLGWPFAAGGSTRDPWVMAGGEQRVSRGVKLLIEGWKFPGSNDVPVVAGVRFVDVKVAVDLGFVRVFGEDQTGIVPWVDFSVKW
jgi:hypothetical protein